jgi:alpha-galactosidase
MVLPEQAASWAYPQPGMSAEDVAFCLVTGLLGRFFLSGYLNQMAPVERELVDEAVRLAKVLRHDISTSTPFWPLGLPRWDDPWVALGLTAGETRYIALWNRDADVPATSLKLLGHGVHSADSLDTIFPQSLPGWHTEWDKEGGTLRVLNPTRSIGARVFRITATDLASTTSHTTIL